MYNIAICDDNKAYIDELHKMVAECNMKDMEITFYDFTNGQDLLESSFREYDVIFLDIQMENMDGNIVAMKLVEHSYQGLLVQFSGIFMPTPDTIKISPYRYLLKQDSREKNINEIRDVLIEMKNRRVCYEIEGSYIRNKIRIRVADIVYFTHHAKGSIVHLCAEKETEYTEGVIIVPFSFRELGEFVFQQFALLNEYKVYDNIELPLLCKRMSMRARKELIHNQEVARMSEHILEIRDGEITNLS